MQTNSDFNNAIAGRVTTCGFDICDCEKHDFFVVPEDALKFGMKVSVCEIFPDN